MALLGCTKFITRPEEYMKLLHDAVVLLSLPSSMRVHASEGVTWFVTKHLWETDENDIRRSEEPWSG